MKIPPGSQPISSVPRDGTLVIVGADNCGEYYMRWNPEAKNPLVGTHKGMWESENKDFTWDESRGAGPEYWRPKLRTN